MTDFSCQYSAPDHELCQTLQREHEKTRRLMTKLLQHIDEAGSELWEIEYQFKDVSEERDRLKTRLSQSITFEDWASPDARMRSALQTEEEAMILNLKKDIHKMNVRHRDLAEQLGQTISENWELSYKCRDLAGEVWRLKVQLRNSVPAGDAEMPSLKPKTALEVSLEAEIRQLKESSRKEAGRGRSRSV